MPALTNVDDLLEEWELLKQKHYPNLGDKDEVMAFVCWKMTIEDHAMRLRTARLINNKVIEQRSTDQFVDAYTRFSKEFIFKVLKNG